MARGKMTNEERKEKRRDLATKVSGAEPSWHSITDASDTLQIMRILNWYSREQDQNMSSRWFCKEFPEIDPRVYVSNGGFLVRMVHRGCPMDLVAEGVRKIYDRALEETRQLKTKQPKVADKPVVKIDRRVDDICAEVDYFVDNVLTGKSIEPKIEMAGLNQKQLGEIKEYCNKLHAELYDCYKKEGYDNFSARQSKTITRYLELLISKANALVPQRTERKPRAKKEKPVAQLVARFRFSKDKLYGLGETPEKLHGKSYAMLYDTRSRKLMFVEGLDGGIKINGINLTNYNEQSSFMKTLRKPEKQIPEIGTQSRAQVRKLMEAIKGAEYKIRPRSTETLTILKVW
jgi:hypothetical protein